MKMKSKNIWLKAGAVTMAFAVGTGVLLPSVLNSGSMSAVYAQEANAYSQVPSDVNVIDATTVWKYLDDNTDPASGLGSLTAWTTSDFNDGAWKSAAGSFGAKRGQLTEFDGFTPTVLLNQYKSDVPNEDVPTFFFRSTFEVENLSEITSITGTLYHDDAVAVYINGNKVLAVDMPAEEQENNLYYAGVSAGAPKEAKLELTKEQIQQYVKEGTNVIAVELHNDRKDSSDIYFEFKNLTLNYGEPEIEQKSVNLTVGSDETSRNLTWYANSETAGQVQYAKKSDMTNGQFPSEYQTADAISSQSNESGFYSNQATMRNLDENTEYVYRVVNGETVSKEYTFQTGDFDGAFSFAFVGDPQIGAGSLPSDIQGWNDTLDVIKNQLNPDFLFSAGDQVNTANNESQYTGYLNDTFSSLTSATTIGNHDSSSAAYNEHFNLPNESAQYGATTAGSDYWFVYNNTLFMDINSNDRSAAEHKQFMQDAIAANPDVRWKTVVFHHSIYSTASHASDGDIIDRRNELPQIFDELDIDVVLMGHDHVYTRTYMMDGFTPDRSQGVQSSVTNPTGILYLTANSASGSKYYGITAPEAEYAAVQDQSKRRTVTNVEVTNTSYTMTTYFADDMSVLDTFTIYKTLNTADMESLISQAQGLNQADYTEESWNKLQAALKAAVELKDNANATQSDIDAATTALQEAIDGLVKVGVNTNTAAMDSLISQAQGLNQADYTEESWNKLQAALKAAMELKSNANATQSDIDAAATALQEAIDGLVKVDNQDGGVVNTENPSNEQINGPQTGDTANAVEIVSAVSAFIAAGTIVVVLTKKKMNS